MVHNFNKKYFISLLMIGFFLLCFSSSVLAQDIHIQIDGYILNSDVAPVIKEDRVLVPFRVIAEAMGIQIAWDNKEKTINATNGINNLLLTVGSKTAYFNNIPVSLDVAPVIINNRAMIPLRFFSNIFDCEVDWVNDSKTVVVKTSPKPMVVVGYYALGDSKTSSWTNLFATPYPETKVGNTKVISDLALGWYSLDEMGQLLTKSRTGWQRPEGWETVLAAADKYNLNKEMVVHMTNEGHIITKLLTNSSSVNNAITQIVSEARNYTGVNLDIEGLGLSERGEDLIQVQNRFSSFVQLLATELHKQGKTISLSLHAPNSSYKGYDYATLGKYSDYIIIMAYDYGPKPEPNDKVDAAITQALQTVPASKLVLGISTPSETVYSFATKISLAKRYNLKGIAIWRLGLVSDEMWQVLESNVKTE